MITIKEFFGNIVSTKTLSDSSLSGRVLSLDTDRKEQRVVMKVSYTAFVPYTEILTLADTIAKKTGIGSMLINPVFQQRVSARRLYFHLLKKLKRTMHPLTEPSRIVSPVLTEVCSLQSLTTAAQNYLIRRM